MQCGPGGQRPRFCKIPKSILIAISSLSSLSRFLPLYPQYILLVRVSRLPSLEIVRAREFSCFYRRSRIAYRRHSPSQTDPFSKGLLLSLWPPIKRPLPSCPYPSGPGERRIVMDKGIARIW